MIYESKPWLKMYDDGVPEFIDFEEKTLPMFLEETVKKVPFKTALIYQGKEISYKEFGDLVDRFSSVLKKMGVKKGDAVAVLLPNIPSCVISFYAILKIGAIAVMNNPLYSDRELQHQFYDSGAKVLVTLDLLVERMVNLREKTSIKNIIYSKIGDFLPFPKNILFKIIAKRKKLAVTVKKRSSLYYFSDLVNESTPLRESTPSAFKDTAIYQYTGGTTGISKGAVLTHGNLSKQIQQVDAWVADFNFGKDERMLGALPFFHVMGLTVSMNYSIYRGWANILIPKPQPDQLTEALSKYKPTIAPLVPTMIIGILNHPGTESLNFDSIKACISGSAPLAVEVIRNFEEKTGAVILEAFGMTESSPATHVNPLGEGKRKVGSIGLPLPDTECKIVSLEDNESVAAVGEPGEMLIRGPQVMGGYHNMPEETAASLSSDQWLKTGDIAKMDNEGFFYIIDRLKDMIISGGYNVYPRDIDEVLFEHPHIQEACCIGVPHETRGEQIKAFVVLNKKEAVTEDELLKYCETKLAKYKLPTEIEFREELPKTNVGKVLRKDLRTEELEKRK